MFFLHGVIYLVLVTVVNSRSNIYHTITCTINNDISSHINGMVEGGSVLYE